MRKLLPILLLVLIVVSGFFIYHFFKSPNSSSELNPIDTSHVQQPIEVATPSETSTIKPYIVKELAKIKSSSDVEQINHFNNQISNTAVSLEDRKKAVDKVVEFAGDAG